MNLQTTRWNNADVTAAHAREVGVIVDRIMSHEDRYKAVDALSNVPWYVIAGLHNMESGGSFAHHLHEGSPLTGRTKYVPKGRPLHGQPPFTWEDSAQDALKYDSLDKVDWRSLEATLNACERYNGSGYLKYHPTVPSPYLWSKTTIEVPGKYTGDGKWEASAHSQQVGIAAIWKVMEERSILNFSKLQP